MQVEHPAVLEVIEDSERFDDFDGISSHVVEVQQWYEGLQMVSDFMVRLPGRPGIKDRRLETEGLKRDWRSSAA